LDIVGDTEARLQTEIPRIPGREEKFFLLRRAQTGRRVHTASYWRPGALSLGALYLGCENDHVPPSSAKVKNVWSYNPPSPYVLMSCTRTSCNAFDIQRTVHCDIFL
jgi:hypothetical protein